MSELTYIHNEPMRFIVMSWLKRGHMTAFTVRISEATAEKLNRLAERVDRSRAYMAAQAIEDFIAREEWQLAEIEAGLSEADRGDFASSDEVARVIGKYVKSPKST
jgi:predicted transcriptional regulator